MKKILFLLSILLGLSIFFSCKSKPVEKSKFEIKHQYISVNKDQSISDKELKIYFPSFMTYDSAKQTQRMVWGDGAIIILPDDKVMMVDCFDGEGQNQLIDFMKSLGITKIDYFFATHNHMDHIGSVPGLLNNFQIENYYWNGVHFNSYGDKNITNELEKHNINTKIIKEGDSIILCHDPLCKVDVLWPNLTEQDIYDAYYNPGKTERLKNNTSLVFKLTYGDFSILFTGDLYKQGDRALVEKYGSELKSTVLKSPHHGEFYTSNSPEFVQTVSPEIGIIQDDQYLKLPISKLVIARIYRKAGAQLLYRHSAGYILITSNGSDYSVTEKNFAK